MKPRLSPSREQVRGSSTERGYGHEWRKVRDQVMRRDNGLCQPHRKQGDTVAGTQVDHITPKAEGGTDHPTNLQVICDQCHEAKTAHEIRERAKGGG